MTTALARRELSEREEMSLEKRARMFAAASNTDLVPKPLRGKAADVFLVITMGARWGLEPAESFGYFHVIEGKVQPSVEFRVAIINNAGHQLRPVHLSATEVTVKGRRRDERNDHDAWVSFTWSIEDARKAGLCDQWVERWVSNEGGRKRPERYKVGDDRGIDAELVKKAPQWAAKLLEAGDVRFKENWVKYPVDMLYARAAGRLCKMLFGDAMLGLPPLDEDLTDELVTPEHSVPSKEHPDPDDNVEDAEIVEDGEQETGAVSSSSEDGAGGGGEADRETAAPAPDAPADGSDSPTSAEVDPDKAKRWAADIHRFAGQVFADDDKALRDRKVDAVIFCATGGRTTSAKALASQLEANNVQMLLRDVQRGDASATATGDNITVGRSGHTFVLAPDGDGLRIVEESQPADDQQRLVS